MKISDRIYGEIEVTEPLILDLIGTRPFQRLKSINQYGGVNLVWPDRYQVSRYEHCLGVFHLLRTVGADTEIQVAGLLHDIGHTAFSHMVDMALSSAGEDYHEEHTHLIEGMDEVDAVLKAHRVARRNADGCPEIKKSLPDVGADRLDYGVRDFVGATNTGAELGRKVLAGIRLQGRDIVFTDLDVAREYALTGLAAMWLVIYEPAVACVYQSLAEIIRAGFRDRWIRPKDLIGDDTGLFEIIRRHRERIPERHFRIFTTPFRVEETDEAHADFKHIKLKVRYFDPEVEVDGERRRLSSMDPDFRQRLEPMKRKFEERKKGAFFRAIFTLAE